MLIVPLLVASLAGAPTATSVRARDPVVALEARMHPIHTSFVDVSNDPSTGATRVTVRVFADDFAQAVSKASGTALGHAANVPAQLAARYVASSLQLMTIGGQAVALQWRGIRRTGDVVWLDLEARLPAGGVMVRSRLLFDVYDDQVNIVQGATGSRRVAALFVRGDGAKRLW